LSELAAILLGFVAGAVGGLLGVGGGILFVPALSIFLDQSQLEAVATSLVAVVLVGLVGAWRQHGYGNLRLGTGIAIGVLSPVGVVAGAVLANNVSERTLEISFACLILFFAARLVHRALTGEAAAEEP
jgi:uncharacterized protein